MADHVFTDDELHVYALGVKAQTLTTIGLLYKGTGADSVPVHVLGQLALDCLAKIDELKAEA